MLIFAFSLWASLAQAGPVTDACQGLVSYLRNPPLTLPTSSPVQLRSSFLTNDPQNADLLRQIASGSLNFLLTLPEHRPQFKDLSSKLVAALRFIGMEPSGFGNGARIDQAALKKIDDALVLAETMVNEKAAKMPFFASLSGANLRSNLPQRYAAYQYVSFFELMEAGQKGYQNLSKDCLLATMYPKVCSVFVGTKDEMTNRCEKLKQPPTLASPALFGFYTSQLQAREDQRPKSDELPELFEFPSSMNFLLGVVHESAHELDSTFEGDPTMHKYYPRKACGKYMDQKKSGSPFNKGSGDDADYVTSYASGSLNNDKQYRPYETFAESLTMFVLAPEYFRALAAQSPNLHAQYDYIKKMIGAEFDNPALKNRTSYKWVSTTTGEFQKFNPVECFVVGEITPRPASAPDPYRAGDPSKPAN